MSISETKLISAVKEFRHFLEEKARYQQALHQLHDASGQLEQALLANAIDGIAVEQQAFKLQEQKMHERADEFEAVLQHYQKALKAAFPALSRPKQLSLHGKNYTLRRKGTDVVIAVV